MSFFNKSPKLVPVAILGFLGVLAPTMAQSAETKQYTMYVGYSAGGSFDAYARRIGKHLVKHLPSGATIVVKYMPGAGTRKLAQYLYARAAKDGSEFGQINSDVILSDLLFGTKSNIDVKALTYIGSPAREPRTCAIWHTVSVKTIDEARSKEVIVGTTNPRTVTGVMPLLINKLIGTKFRPIAGYSGGSAQFLAMERGEIEARCVSYNTLMGTKSDWIKDKKLRFLLQVTASKLPELPDVPLIMDLMKSDADKEALKLMFTDQEIGFPMIAPPGVSAEAKTMLRNAFAKTMKDPQFLADAKRAHFAVNPVTGAEIEKLVEYVYSAPQSVVDHARSLLKMK